MEDYDPNRNPDADEWLDLDEQERMALVADYHREHRVRMRSVEAHAAIHTIVENQLALDEPVVVATLARLRREGLDRHDAVHAIGSALASRMHSLLVGEQSEREPNETVLQGTRKALSEHVARGLTALQAPSPSTDRDCSRCEAIPQAES